MSAIVLIDLGNTRLKVGVIDGAAASLAKDTRTNTATTTGLDAATGAGSSINLGLDEDNLKISTYATDNDDAQGLRDWLAGLPIAPTAALGTNVAGAVRGTEIEDALAAHGCEINWIVPQAQAYGLTSRYTRPEQLGADRWVSMLGVSAALNPETTRPPFATRPPFLLATFGTATTLDTVSSDGVFEGGLILPGPALMRQSLVSGTANLPLAHGALQDFPTDTHQAISSGVAAAQAGAVVRQWLAGFRRYGQAPMICVAGGGWQEVETETRRLLADAATATNRLPPIVRVIENPVLKGLAYIAATTNLGSP